MTIGEQLYELDFKPSFFRKEKVIIGTEGVHIVTKAFTGDVTWDLFTGVGYHKVNTNHRIAPFVKVPGGSGASLLLEFSGLKNNDFLLFDEHTAYKHSSKKFDVLFDAYQAIATPTFDIRLSPYLIEYENNGYFTFNHKRFTKELTVENDKVTLSMKDIFMIYDASGTLWMSESKRPMAPGVKKVSVWTQKNGDVLYALCKKLFGWQLP